MADPRGHDVVRTGRLLLGQLVGDLGLFLGLDRGLLGLLAEGLLPDLDLVVARRDVGDLEASRRRRSPRSTACPARSTSRCIQPWASHWTLIGHSGFSTLSWIFGLNFGCAWLVDGFTVAVGVDVVQDAVAVGDVDRAAGRERQHVRMELAGLLVERRDSWSAPRASCPSPPSPPRRRSRSPPSAPTCRSGFTLSLPQTSGSFETSIFPGARRRARELHRPRQACRRR